MIPFRRTWRVTDLLIDRDLPLIERARALQWYKDIKFPMGAREEKRLSKEGWLGSCSVRGGRPKPMVTEKHLFLGFYRRLLVHLLSTSTRRWNYIWYAIRLVVSISSDVKRYSSLRSGALSCRWITYFWPVSLLRRFERRSVGLSSARSLPLKGARKAKAGNSRVERTRIEYDRTSSFELSRVSALVHNPAAIESA